MYKYTETSANPKTMYITERCSITWPESSLEFGRGESTLGEHSERRGGEGWCLRHELFYLIDG